MRILSDESKHQTLALAYDELTKIKTSTLFLRELHREVSQHLSMLPARSILTVFSHAV